MLSKAVFLAAVGLAMGQAPTPTWFLQSGLEGDFTMQSDQCESLFESKKAESSNGPILIPEGVKAVICINFPPIPEKNLAGGWRYDEGSKGACVNGCCEFKPPTKAPLNTDHPTWFETAGDCSAVPESVTPAPTLFQGKNGDAKTLCIKGEDGAYVESAGKLGNCAFSGCCIWYIDQ